MVTNSEFLEAVYGSLGAGVHGWIACFRGDPNAVTADAWAGQPWLATANQRLLIDKRHEDNNYYSVARLSMGDNKPRRAKSNFSSLAALVADDANKYELNGSPSFIIATSPGKYQIGAILDETDPDTRDAKLIDAVMQAMADAELINADSSGNNAVRYCRVPVGTNGKGGRNVPVQLEEWNPGNKYTLEDAVALFGLDLDVIRTRASRVTQRVTADVQSDAENAELMRRILTGESYHDPLMKLSAKMVASGAAGGAVVNMLRGIMDAARPGSPGELERWQARYNEIPRMVQGAERFRPEQLPAVTINLGGTKEAPAAPAELAPMDWSALSGTVPEPAVFRWRGWLPARTTTLLSANGGVGKSNLSLQLAASLAIGGRFLNEELEPARVLVISAEDEARTVHFRLSNICADLGVSLGDLNGRLVAYDLTQVDCVMWREGGPTARMQWLADVVEQHQADVVIVDNVSDVFNANENDRAEVRGFMRSFNAIAQHSGAAVLLLAHVDKASVRMGAGNDTNSTFSGSTAWNNSARSRWAMTREGEAITLRHEKCNLGALQEEIRLEFDPVAKVFRRFGQVPGAQAARELLRKSQRDAVFKLVASAIRANQRVSLAPQSNNNAYNVVRGSSNFPANMKRGDFFAMLHDFMREGLIEEVEYQVGRSSKTARALGLTAAGLEASLPSWER